jgi:CheY-like chemotaxis protein
MNGRELVDRLRERPRPADRRALSVVYMSGFASTVISDQFPLEAHAGFLQKPFGLDDLRERLAHALANARS